MKRFFLCLVLLLAFCTISSSAFAYDTNFFTSNTQGGSFIDTFTKSQDIWLYINLPKTGLSITNYWFSAPDTTPYLSLSDPTTARASWYKINDLAFYKDGDDTSTYSWDQIVDLGDWNVAATYSYPGKTNISGRYEANFTITPEPVSAALFLVGGIGLAVLRRKKA